MSQESNDSHWNFVPPPDGEDDVHARHESNRAAWNEGAMWYSAQIEETIEFIRSGQSNLHPVERRNLGDLSRFETAVHLQCASGRDSLSLWVEGVQRVIGVDISDVHIANARRISEALGAPAEWYRSDVLAMPQELDGSADLVYTGRGALCWLQDIESYARAVYRLLQPGGVYHVFDDHPVNWLFDTNADRLQYSGLNYFEHFEANTGWPTTYIGDSLEVPQEKQARKYEALWKIADIFNAFTGAGLRVEYLGEHPDTYWDIAPNIPPEELKRIPITFSMLARKEK